MSDKPWPDGFIFGGTQDVWHDTGGWEVVQWFCVFDFIHDGVWECTYKTGPEDEASEIDALKGRGPTPRDAFESLIKVWTFANGGVESPALRKLLPGLRTVFMEDGFVYPEGALAQLS